jgi:hypothetical protein
MNLVSNEANNIKPIRSLFNQGSDGKDGSQQRSRSTLYVRSPRKSASLARLLDNKRPMKIPQTYICSLSSHTTQNQPTKAKKPGSGDPGCKDHRTQSISKQHLNHTYRLLHTFVAALTVSIGPIVTFHPASRLLLLFRPRAALSFDGLRLFQPHPAYPLTSPPI